MVDRCDGHLLDAMKFLQDEVGLDEVAAAALMIRLHSETTYDSLTKMKNEFEKNEALFKANPVFGDLSEENKVRLWHSLKVSASTAGACNDFGGTNVPISKGTQEDIENTGANAEGSFNATSENNDSESISVSAAPVGTSTSTTTDPPPSTSNEIAQRSISISDLRPNFNEFPKWIGFDTAHRALDCCFCSDNKESIDKECPFPPSRKDFNWEWRSLDKEENVQPIFDSRREWPCPDPLPDSFVALFQAEPGEVSKEGCLTDEEKANPSKAFLKVACAIIVLPLYLPFLLLKKLVLDGLGVKLIWAILQSTLYLFWTIIWCYLNVQALLFRLVGCFILQPLVLVLGIPLHRFVVYPTLGIVGYAFMILYWLLLALLECLRLILAYSYHYNICKMSTCLMWTYTEFIYPIAAPVEPCVTSFAEFFCNCSDDDLPQIPQSNEAPPLATSSSSIRDRPSGPYEPITDEAQNTSTTLDAGHLASSNDYNNNNNNSNNNNNNNNNSSSTSSSSSSSSSSSISVSIAVSESGGGNHKLHPHPLTLNAHLDSHFCNICGNHYCNLCGERVIHFMRCDDCDYDECMTCYPQNNGCDSVSKSPDSSIADSNVTGIAYFFTEGEAAEAEWGNQWLPVTIDDASDPSSIRVRWSGDEKSTMHFSRIRKIDAALVGKPADNQKKDEELNPTGADAV